MSDKELIYGSGLFFFLSDLPDVEKIEIINWYKSLPEKERGFVDTIRAEGIADHKYFTHSE